MHMRVLHTVRTIHSHGAQITQSTRPRYYKTFVIFGQMWSMFIFTSCLVCFFFYLVKISFSVIVLLMCDVHWPICRSDISQKSFSWHFTTFIKRGFEETFTIIQNLDEDPQSLSESMCVCECVALFVCLFVCLNVTWMVKGHRLLE